MHATAFDLRILALTLFLVTGASLAATGGPDAFGYRWVDSNEPGGPEFIPLDLSLIGTQVLMGTSVSSLSPPPSGMGAPLTLTVPFDFYGQQVTQVIPTSSGVIATGGTDPAFDVSNDCPLPLPPSTGGGARLYPLHDQLDVGALYYHYFCACPRPADRGVATGCHMFHWDNADHLPATGSTFDFWTILYDTGDIVFQVGAGNMEQGSGSTTGIQNDGATDGLTVACNLGGSVPDDYAVVLFHPGAPRLRILNLHDTDPIVSGAPPTPNPMRDVAVAMDAELTVVATRTMFRTQFDTGGPWDVIVYSAWGAQSLIGDELDRLLSHAQAGGRVILNDWSLFQNPTAQAHPLLATHCPVGFVGEYTSYQPIYPWMDGHPIWRTPRLITASPIPATGPPSSYAVDGQFLEAFPGSYAVAGYTGTTPLAGDAAIVASCDNTVIVNGFTPQTLQPDLAADLLIDEISLGSRNILVWDDTTRQTTGYWNLYAETFADAGHRLGYAPTLADSESDFTDWLGLACWDLTAIDAGNYQASISTYDLVQNHVNSGAPTIFGHWAYFDYSAHPLLAQEGITAGAMFSGGESLHDWTSGSGPLMSAPNAVPTLGPAPVPTLYGSFGFRHDAPPTQPQAGLTASPMVGEALVSFGASPNLIFNSFILDQFSYVDNDGDHCADVLELAENEIEYFLGQLCTGVCGDCNLSGSGPDILDALTAAQVGVGLIVPSMEQQGCCDVDASGAVDVLDALRMAQGAAGLWIMVSCP